MTKSFLSLNLLRVLLTLTLIIGCSNKSDFNDANVESASSRGIRNGQTISEEILPTVGKVAFTISGMSSTCTGTLITPRHVLTAAHCVVYLGKTVAANIVTFSFSPSSVIAASKVAVHPEYNHLVAGDINDIAILTLSQEQNVGELIPLDSLFFYPQQNNTIEIVGYGLSDNSNTSIGNSGLKRMGKAAFWGYDYGMLIVGPEDKQLACKGDSGGPAIYNDGKSKKIVGVLSALSRSDETKHCDTAFINYYVPVFEKLDWIKSESSYTTDSLILSLISDQNISQAGQFSLTLAATSSDRKAKLSYQVIADYTFDRAKSLSEKYKLNSLVPSKYNTLKLNEKYLLGIKNGINTSEYFIMPNGEIHSLYSNLSKVEVHPLLGVVDPVFYEKPELLINAANLKPRAQATIQDNTLVFNPNVDFAGALTVKLSVSDGVRTTSQLFQVVVTPFPIILDRSYSKLENGISFRLNRGLRPGLTQSAKVLSTSGQSSLAAIAYELKKKYGLYYITSVDYNRNLHKYNERWLGTTAAERWVAILPNGEVRLYKGDGKLTFEATNNIIGKLDASYYNDPSKLYNAIAPPSPVTVEIVGDTLSIKSAKGFSGSVDIEISITDGVMTHSQSFKVTIENTAPMLSFISDINMKASESLRTISLSASDKEGDALTYSASIVKSHSLAVIAYELKKKYGLSLYPGGYSTNAHKYNEKWLVTTAAERWVAILPNGEVRLYKGDGKLTFEATNNIIGKLDASYYNDPTKLLNAVAPPTSVTIEIAGDKLLIQNKNGFTGSAVIEVVVTDGTASQKQSFNVTIENIAPVLSFISTIQMKVNELQRTLTLFASDADGDTLTYSSSVVSYTYSQPNLAVIAYELKTKYGLYLYPGGYSTNAHKYNEKWLGTTAPERYVAILPNGEVRLYKGDGKLTFAATNNIIGKLDASYYNDPSKLFNAIAPPIPVTVEIAGDKLTIKTVKGFVGSAVIEVSVTDGLISQKQSFNVTIENIAPVLSFISTIQMKVNELQRTLTLFASDADGDTLAYSSSVVSYTYSQPNLAVIAYELKTKYGLYLYPGGYSTNAHKYNEKWLGTTAPERYVAILPNGEVRLYKGDGKLTFAATNNIIGKLDASYYNDPSKLFNAIAPPIPVTVEIAGDKLTIKTVKGFVGSAVIEITVTDGIAPQKQSFQLSVTE